MIIDCISDLHGYFPKMEGGDLLIVAGDICGLHGDRDLIFFADWISKQKYKKKVVIAGNHDVALEEFGQTLFNCINFDYLCDTGTEFEGLKMWGSPWTHQFSGINPHCKAFTGSYENDSLKEKWELIPKDTDILITHCPPYNILDTTKYNEHVGDVYLLDTIIQVKPFLHVFGHVHECGGMYIQMPDDIQYINASHMNEYYEPIHKPVRVIL